MATVGFYGNAGEPEVTSIPPVPGQTAEEVRAWEVVTAGRYMPRRIRGSYRGRELG
jgi:hypothetical protein